MIRHPLSSTKYLLIAPPERKTAICDSRNIKAASPGPDSLVAEATKSTPFTCTNITVADLISLK